MEKIVSLNKINRSDNEIVGFKAVDLAELFNKKVNIPICFVITTELFDEFIREHNLKEKIDLLLKETDYEDKLSLQKTYDEIKKLFLERDFSENVKNDLVEAYETLAVDMDHIDIAKLVTAIDKPFLTMMGSPNYVGDSENNDSIFMNIKGKIALFNTIKNCWASLYSPNALQYRQRKGLQIEEKMAIIIQRMVDAEISCQTFNDEDNIIVQTFIGYQDFEGTIGKDVMVFTKNSLNIKNSKINFQEYFIGRELMDGTLTKKALKDKGGEQKLNDKDCEELARITKRIEDFLETPIKVFICIRKGKIYVLLANRIGPKLSGIVEEEAINGPILNVDEEENNLEDDLAFIEEMEQQDEEDASKFAEPKKILEKVEEKITNLITNDFTIYEEESQTYDLPVELEETNKEYSEPQEEIEKEISFEPEESVADILPEKEEPHETFNEIIEEEKTEEISTPKIKSPETLYDKEDEFIFSTTEETHSNIMSEETPSPEVEKSGLDKAQGYLKELVMLSEESIFKALKAKQEEILETSPENIDEAIISLRSKVTIPFEEEIKAIVVAKNNIMKGKDVEIEEATNALRTAKNFLILFGE